MGPRTALAVTRHDPGERPGFVYDFGTPEAYLALERLVEVLRTVPELIPVHADALPGGGGIEGFRCEEDRRIWMAEMERLAARRGLQALRWPDPWPPDTELAALAATYARGIGKVAAFSLAAFRQAYAGGRDLADRDTVLIAAAACEIHPRALLAALERRGIREALEAATAQAAAAGVRALPALLAGGRVFAGDAGLEQAAAVLAGRAR